MKKLFTFLSLFLCFASGAWAINTNGAMNGVFSVSSTKKVVFSQGNLQYVGTWQFAEKQWDCFSTSQSDNHRDLFGWGTGDAPNKVSKNNSDYSTFTDWGTNAITNGGNTANVWRTLTKDEWVYLFYTRENAATLFGFGNVAGVNGLIILLDDWKTPEGASFTASTTLGLTDLGVYYHNANNDNYTHNTYTAEQWAVMESADAVFLPAAAYRNGTTVDYIDYGGFYWSSTPESANNAYYLNFYYNDLAPQFKEVRYGGRPVRLVKDYQLQQDSEGYYLLGTAQNWKDFAAIINNGTNPAANAKMTADIDLGDDQTKIGSESTPYQGTFDGKGYSLTVAYVETDGSSQYVAPFIRIQNATIQNLHVKGSVTTAGKGPAGLASQVKGDCYIRNCWSEVDITSSYDGDIGAGGLVAWVLGTGDGIYMDDCIFSGSITFSHSNGYRAGGLVGYCPSASAGYVKNCLFAPRNISTIKMDATSNRVFVSNYKNSEDIPITNCYYVNAGTSANWRAQGKEVQSSQLADGSLAYKLQAFREDLIWGQKLGTDAMPVPFAADESSRVYRINDDSGFTNDPAAGYVFHQDTDGYYLVGSLAGWQDFAALVETTPNANAKLTADINLGDDQTIIATTYRGTFDGQENTLTVNLTATSNYGLFKFLDGATIKNLHVTGNITSSYSVGGIVGTSNSGTNTLANCRSSIRFVISGNVTVGGLVLTTNDYDILNMSDCLFDGSFEGSTSSATWGGILGYNYYSTVNISNSLFAPTSINIKDNLYPFYSTGYGGCTLTNCYTSVSGTDTQGTQATEEELASGTITANLQANREETVWVQDPLTNQPMLALFAGKYTVPASGLGTFSAKTNFTLPEGLEAYTCKTYDSGKSTISTQKVEGTIPANTGVLMKGIGGETYTLVASSQTPEAIEGNALIAVVEATHVDQTVGEYTNFMMSGGKFVKIAASSNPNDKIPANRAYLPILTSALPAGSGQSITVNWDEETGVKAVRNAQFMINSYYTLDGRKLNGAPSKGGVYINNGKKVIK